MMRYSHVHTRLWLSLPLALLLTACPFRENPFDLRVDVSHPVVTVSAEEAAVGEFIEVTVTNFLYPQRLATEGPATVALIVCFKPDWLEDFDNCSHTPWHRL
jgi:hypothetical protein